MEFNKELDWLRDLDNARKLEELFLESNVKEIVEEQKSFMLLFSERVDEVLSDSSKSK